MTKQQSGFTLIELIAVIVILGILAAVAVPRFVDLSDEAQTSAARALAANISSASSLNHALDVAQEAGLTSSGEAPVEVASCDDGANLLEGGLPTGYSIAQDTTDADNPTPIPVGEKASISCTLSHTSGASADFTLIGARPS